jgi:lipopolysaccharide transport protein LptA
MSIRRCIMPGHHLSQNARRAAFCLLALFLSIQNGFCDILDLNSDDTVTITAEKAWEDDNADITHFSGRFELRAPDWSLSADSATVYGKLDDPDKLVVEGKPAKIFILRDTEKSTSGSASEPNIEGVASTIEYYRTTNKLKMHGAAVLTREDNTLSSEIIEYDIDEDSYSASGEGGISIHFSPDD